MTHRAGVVHHGGFADCRPSAGSTQLLLLTAQDGVYLSRHRPAFLGGCICEGRVSQLDCLGLRGGERVFFFYGGVVRKEVNYKMTIAFGNAD